MNVSIKRLSYIRKEIAGLRKKLIELNDSKEAKYEELKRHKLFLSGAISEAKELLRKRDELTDSVKTLKKEREEASSGLKEQIAEVKEARKKNSDSIKNLNIKKSPKSVRDEIERMETKIETEVLPFEKEQKLMSLIKQKKKELKEAEKHRELWEKTAELSSKINEKREKTEKLHEETQKRAKESQSYHEGMLSLSKKISEIAMLKEKSSKAMTEKIKSGKKLTTEDLLAFQGSSKD